MEEALNIIFAPSSTLSWTLMSSHLLTVSCTHPKHACYNQSCLKCLHSDVLGPSKHGSRTFLHPTSHLVKLSLPKNNCTIQIRQLFVDCFSVPKKCDRKNRKNCPEAEFDECGILCKIDELNSKKLKWCLLRLQ